MQSGDLFWVSLNLKHMEHYNFLAGLCGKCLTSSCGSFVRRGAESYQGTAYHSDTGCQQGSWCKRGSDSVALACFHREWGDIVTLGCAPQRKQEQQWRPQRLSNAVGGIIFCCISVRLEIVLSVAAFLLKKLLRHVLCITFHYITSRVHKTPGEKWREQE